MEGETLIRCTCCGVPQDGKKEFSPDKSKPSGRRSHCKTCVRKKQKKYVRRNKKKVYAYNKKWQKKNFKRWRGYNKKWYEKKKNKNLTK